jgi:cytochrome d ubiquinol oxidase subunit II
LPGLAKRAWLVTLALTILTTIATFSLRPALLASFADRPWGVVLPVFAVTGLGAMWCYNLHQSDGRSLLASGAYLAGMMLSAAFTVYPNVLPAIAPEHSLTVSNAAGPSYGLAVGLAWRVVGMVLAAVYFVLIYRLFGGKVQQTDSGY